MKTIFTSLPIYDRKAKQCFERAKYSRQETDPPVPIVCPQHRLPAFQWNAETDTMGDVMRVEMFGKDYSATETTLSTAWVDDAGWDTFVDAGLNITSATNAAGIASAYTTANFNLEAGEQVILKGTFTLADGSYPIVFIGSGITHTLVEGYQEISMTAVRTLTNIHVSLYINGYCDFAFTGVTVTKIANQEEYKDLTEWFPTLPYESNLTTDTYYSYDSDILNFPMPTGTFYLKITMENNYILYSDWFEVDCVYNNLIKSWTNGTYETLTADVTEIVSAIETGADGTVASSAELFSIRKGETITIVTYLTTLSGQLPYVKILAGALHSVSDTKQLAAGLNTVTLTCTDTHDDAYVYIFNVAAASWATTPIMAYRDYSTKYLTINFSNTCDLGDILYTDGMEQTIWFESETMETSFPQEEEGVNNGNNRFVRAFARQTKKYVARTKAMPSFMVDVFNRMRLHDTVSLIDLVGDENTVYNLEAEHEWLDNDKYYAIIVLTFDYNEAFVVAGCCNNLT